MKKILFLFPVLLLLGMKFEEVRELKPTKEELIYNKFIPQCEPQSSPFCLAGTTPANWTQDNELAPYVHCSSCGYGVFTGEEGKESCTFCGVKKVYAPRQ